MHQLQHLWRNYNPVEHHSAALQKDWNIWFDDSLNECTHGPGCSALKRGDTCTVGRRIEREYLLTGAILPVWKVVASTILKGSTSQDKDRRHLRIVQAETTTGEHIIGLKVPANCVEPLETALQECEETAGLMLVGGAL